MSLLLPPRMWVLLPSFEWRLSESFITVEVFNWALNSSKAALLFSYHHRDSWASISVCIVDWVEETGPAGHEVWHNVCPTALVTWKTASERCFLVRQNTHTSSTHSWLSSSRLCVSFVLSSPTMVSLVVLCLTVCGCVHFTVVMCQTEPVLITH